MFERRADFKHSDASTCTGENTAKKKGTAKRGTGGWDKSMRAARKQAKGYARRLPVSHRYPPFLLMVDIGHVIEIYTNFSGQGKNYA